MAFPPSYRKKKSKVAQKKKGGRSYQQHQDENATAAERHQDENAAAAEQLQDENAALGDTAASDKDIDAAGSKDAAGSEDMAALDLDTMVPVQANSNRKRKDGN